MSRIRPRCHVDLETQVDRDVTVDVSAAVALGAVAAAGAMYSVVDRGVDVW